MHSSTSEPLFRRGVLQLLIKEMQSQYNDAIPNEGLLSESEELSCINDRNAFLYANGENVYIWKIIPVE